MLKYEVRLVDPTAGQVADALGAACREANKRCRARLLRDDPAGWRRFARQTANAFEGWHRWRGGRGGTPASLVFAAWWTDPLGRRHVRVTGRRAGDDDHGVPDEDVPPLRHVYPERVYLRPPEVVAVCGCGAAGPPERLGWLGPTCGPCWDFEQDHGRPAFPAPALLTGNTETVRAVAVDSTGRWVAGVEWSGQVLIWDQEAGPEPAWTAAGLSDPGGGPGSVTVGLSPGAGRVYVGLDAGAVVRTSAASTPPTEVGLCSAFAVGPDGRVVVFLSALGIGVAPAAESRPGRWVGRLLARGVGVAVSPDGLTAAVRYDTAVRLHDLADGTARVMFPPPADRAAGGEPQPSPPPAFAPDGRLLAVAVGRIVHVRELPSVRLLAEAVHPAPVTGLAWAAGRLLVARVDGTLLAADPAAPGDGVNLRWHLGPVHGLAASPDGRTVATCGGEGVKLWPIARLVGE